jgi:hypothetical protein
VSLRLPLRTVPAVVPVPHLEPVRVLFAALTGRDIEIGRGAEPVAVGGAAGSVVGRYVDGALETRALVAFDLALAAHAGAALGLLPVDAAEDAIACGVLPHGLLQNASEVLTIVASLFNQPGCPHLRLYRVFGPTDDPGADVRELAVRTAPRDDMWLELARYGRGRLSIVVR